MEGSTLARVRNIDHESQRLRIIFAEAVLDDEETSIHSDLTGDDR